MGSDADLSTDDLAGRGGSPHGGPAGAGGGGLDQGSGATAGGAMPGTSRVRDAPAGTDTAGTDAAGRFAAGQDAADQGLGGAVLGETADPGARGRGAGDAGDAMSGVALLAPEDSDRFRQRWSDAQARFVDDPQDAVRTADGLVAELMQSLARGFSEHKGQLEAQWQRGGNPDTEELRQALQMYRSFFNRLLST